MFGTVVVAGHVYQIVKLSLRDGMLIITASGPLPEQRATQEPATVFGEDGKGFAQAWPCDIPSRMEGMVRGQNWVTIELPIRIDRIENVTE